MLLQAGIHSMANAVPKIQQTASVVLERRMIPSMQKYSLLKGQADMNPTELRRS